VARETELREKIRYCKIKFVKSMSAAIKKVQDFKFEVNNMRK